MPLRTQFSKRGKNQNFKNRKNSVHILLNGVLRVPMAEAPWELVNNCGGAI